MNITKLTAREMKEKLISKEISSREIVSAHLDIIEKKEEDINAFITVTKEEALNAADKIDKKIKNGEKLGPLAGIPIGIKDNIITKDIKTTCGSKMLENFIPPYDATVIEKIKHADGIIIGKNNMDEFAMGSSTETSFFGPTKNPLDLERVPGGSSGGSSAGVAAYEMALGLASDTGGSIRQPASFCGLVGIRPTYGLASRYGLVSMANSLDQIGVIGRNVEDATLLLETIMGQDRKDSTSIKIEDKNLMEKLTKDIKGMKIAVPREFFDVEIDSRVKDTIKNSIEIFEKLGANIEEVSMPHIKYSLATYNIIANAEASSNLSRFDGIRYGYRTKEHGTLDELYMNTRGEALGKEVKNRIMAGTYYLSSGHREKYYNRALKLRTLIAEDFNKTFKDYDIILSPISALPSKIGENNNYKSHIFTVPASLAGLPAMSIPCGYIEGLPVGLQLIGDKFQELNILNAAFAFERHLSLGGERNEI